MPCEPAWSGTELPGPFLKIVVADAAWMINLEVDHDDVNCEYIFLNAAFPLRSRTKLQISFEDDV